MYQRAHTEFWASVEKVTEWDAFARALENKHMVLAPWCVTHSCRPLTACMLRASGLTVNMHFRADEEAIEEDVKKRSATADATGATAGAKTLCIPLEQPELPEGTLCFASGKPAKNWALWGRSY